MPLQFPDNMGLISCLLFSQTASYVAQASFKLFMALMTSLASTPGFGGWHVDERWSKSAFRVCEECANSGGRASPQQHLSGSLINPRSPDAE